MALGKKKVFTRRNGNQKGGELYRWSPIPTDKIAKGGNNNAFFCTATPRSQGEDWKVTYVYQVVLDNGVEHRIAYVECDYVI